MEGLHIVSEARYHLPCSPHSSFRETIIMHTTSDRHVHTHDIELVTVMGAVYALGCSTITVIASIEVWV
jgi:hypothetical protein